MLNSTVAGVVVGAFLLFSCAAGAEEARTPPLGEIRAQQEQMRGDVLAGKGIYKEMSREKRDELARRQSDLIALLGEHQSLDELSEADKTRAFNTLEWIKATVTNAEDARVVCERKRPVGSNRVQRVCATVAERRIQRQSVEDGLVQRSLCNGEELCVND